MIITWEFANDEKVTLEVDDEIGFEIMESRRKEENLERKERYHNYSVEAIEYEGKEYASELDICEEMLREDFTKDLYETLDSLSAVQKRRLLLFIEGYSTYEIARKEKVSHKNVYKTILQCRKIFEKFL